jgi:hypothetical protein
LDKEEKRPVEGKKQKKQAQAGTMNIFFIVIRNCIQDNIVGVQNFEPRRLLEKIVLIANQY